MTKLASPYTVTRQNGQKDAKALRYALEFAGVKHSTHATVLREIADRIDEQMPKPAIEEPKEFGSIVCAVRASNAPASDRLRWHRVQVNLMTYWQSEIGTLAMWSELTDVEVLRAGVGEDMKARVLAALRSLRDIAITAERKDAYRKAIEVVEEVA